MSVNGPPHATFSAILLAGGASQRMGRDKRLLPWDTDNDGRDRSLLQAVTARLAGISTDVIVVTNDEPAVRGTRIVRDAFPGAGSLGGIYSGVLAANHERSFVAGADMPFLDLMDAGVVDPSASRKGGPRFEDVVHLNAAAAKLLAARLGAFHRRHFGPGELADNGR